MNSRETGSGGLIELDQAHVGASFGGELGGEEFLERVGLGHRPEHIGEPVAAGVSDGQFGGSERLVVSAQPTANGAPPGAGLNDGAGLPQPWDDAPDLDGPCIGRELAPDWRALPVGLPVQGWGALAPAAGDPVLHPAGGGVGAHGVEGLLDAALDVEPPAVAAEDRQGVQGEVGAEEDQTTPGGGIDQDPADPAPQRAPAHVQAAGTQLNPLLAVHGAGGGDEY